MNKKVKHYEQHQFRKTTQKYVDQDYYEDLNDEDKAYLDRFNQEYYLDSCGSEPLHNTPELRKSISDSNNARRRDVLNAYSNYVISDSVLGAQYDKHFTEVLEDDISDMLTLHGYEATLKNVLDTAVEECSFTNDYDELETIILNSLFNMQKIIKLERANKKKKYI